MSLVVIPPVAMTDALLVSTDVPEADYAAYSAATTYAKGDRVIRTGVHKIYESSAAGNIGNTPETSPTLWLEVSATNRWRCFDTSNSSRTVKTGGMSYRITPGQVVNSVNVLNAVADTVRIRMIDPAAGTVYDQTTSLLGPLPASSWYSWFYARRNRGSQVVALNLPGYYAADILVDLTVASGNAEMGVLLFGYQQSIGEGIEYGARVGITDYSRKELNDFGDVVFVERAFAKRASFSMKVLNTEIDTLQDFLASLRATPCLIVGTTLYACTVIYGWFGDFEILIAYPTHSDCTLDVKGLT